MCVSVEERAKDGPEEEPTLPSVFTEIFWFCRFRFSIFLYKIFPLIFTEIVIILDFQFPFSNLSFPLRWAKSDSGFSDFYFQKVLSLLRLFRLIFFLGYFQILMGWGVRQNDYFVWKSKKHHFFLNLADSVCGSSSLFSWQKIQFYHFGGDRIYLNNIASLSSE